MKERLLSQKVTGISLGERAHIALGSIHLRYMAKRKVFSSCLSQPQIRIR